MGFVLVPTDENNAEETRPLSELLSRNQRRIILESIMTWKPYNSHSDVNDKVSDEDEGLQHSNAKVCHREAAEAGGSNFVADSPLHREQPVAEDALRAGSDATQENAPATSLAFPSHEEPSETCCAICLDDFADGEMVNDRQKCPHHFHRACLMSWLDRHSVCPCCRRVMVTESEWARGMQQHGMRPYQVRVTHMPGQFSAQQVAMMNL
jgi:hypothetical protein